MKNELILSELLEKAALQKASDVFIIAGRPLSYRRGETIIPLDDQPLTQEETEYLIRQIYAHAPTRPIEKLLDSGDDDFSFHIPEIARFRVSAFKQRGSLSAVIRIISFDLPHPSELHIPENIIELGKLSSGMVLVSGHAGSGKSTTLACIIDYINRTRTSHIITLEDPLEYLHKHDHSIISQREIGLDSTSYVTGLRAALRQSPDVILLGEMRDFETISVAMTAAETGHLLFSTLHTTGAVNTINRIIDVFPADQQKQIAVQLSTVLNAVVSQQLVPAIDGSIIPVFEIMTVTPAIRNMIREGKVHQIDGTIRSSAVSNMISMDDSLLKLFRNRIITKETALTYAFNPELLEKKL